MKRVLILSMKENSAYVTRVQSMLAEQRCQILLVNEEQPSSLSTKMDLILSSEVVVILATLKLQRNMRMMELAMMAYEKYKVMVVYVVEKGYRPFGILGKVAETNDDCNEGHLDNLTPSEFLQAVNSRVKSHVRLDLGTMESMTAPPKPKGDKVFVHTAGDAPREIQALEASLNKAGVPFTRLNTTKVNNFASCCVYIPVISALFLTNKNTEGDFERQMLAGAHLRPVVCGDIKVNDAPGWCRLALCGKKLFKSEEATQLAEETKKLAKVSNHMDLLQIQAFENDLNDAIPFSL